METIQYNAALGITGTIGGSSREKLYQELRLQILQQRCWYVKRDFFKNTFFLQHQLSGINQIERLKTLKVWKLSEKRVLPFIRPSANSTFNFHNPKEIKLLSRLRLGLSRLREHMFKHSFQDSQFFSSAVVKKVKLKLVLIVCSTVPAIPKNDRPS